MIWGAFYQNSIEHKVNKGDNASPCSRPQWISKHQTETSLYGHDFKSYWEISWALNKKVQSTEMWILQESDCNVVVYALSPLLTLCSVEFWKNAPQLLSAIQTIIFAPFWCWLTCSSASMTYVSLVCLQNHHTTRYCCFLVQLWNILALLMPSACLVSSLKIASVYRQQRDLYKNGILYLFL